eukprot:m.85556 g.85556  ORF g.85556 m.85556 type:complete len:244 (-) comp11396_c0_seq1:59-790(-)
MRPQRFSRPGNRPSLGAAVIAVLVSQGVVVLGQSLAEQRQLCHQQTAEADCEALRFTSTPGDCVCRVVGCSWYRSATSTATPTPSPSVINGTTSAPTFAPTLQPTRSTSTSNSCTPLEVCPGCARPTSSNKLGAWWVYLACGVFGLVIVAIGVVVLCRRSKEDQPLEVGLGFANNNEAFAAYQDEEATTPRHSQEQLDVDENTGVDKGKTAVDDVVMRDSADNPHRYSRPPSGDYLYIESLDC